MNKILCSTGAIIGKPNNNDYRLLKEYAPRLECDGFHLNDYGGGYMDWGNIRRLFG